MDTLSSTISAIISATEMTLSEFRHELLWALIVGIILAFVLGFGMGANDVANAFGTSVGSGVLTLKWAYILATIFETLGALLVGYNVTDTMRKNVVDLGLYGDQPKELLVGQVAILAGCSAWLLIATLAHLPVSTTHSLTGATVGFGLATRGASGIHWSQIGAIVGSWFLSPVLSGIVSSILFMIVDFSVLRRDNPLKCGFRVIPIFYWFCIAFNTFAVSFQGSKRCSAWLLIATLAHLPVSTTHSLTGATVGFGLATRGASGIHWSQIGAIVGSWFLSPVLSGIVSSILFMIVDFSVLRRDNPLKCGFRVIPIFYWFCIAFNTFAVSFQGSKLLHLSQLPLWLSVCVSFGLASVCAVLVHFIMVPRLKKWIEKTVVEQHKSTFVNFDDECDDDLSNVSLSKNEQFLNGVIVCEKPPIWTTSSSDCSRSSITSGISLKTLQSTHAPTIIDSVKGFFEWLMPKRGIQEDPKTMKVFSSIQLVTACFAGFAHGANDVSNAIAPLTSLIAIYTQMDVHQKGETPIYVLIFGVFAICLGLVCLGKKVIRTVGTKMSEINPASGFTIEFGAAVTTLLASKVGLPISTTHSLVGSVVAVGTIKSGEGVDWKIFRNIAISWVVTLPVCGAISAGLMYLLKFTL
ncbi:Sodium-dependent phosphate transporter 1 [Toxocara canis]|uniref:Phosphate transporter n=1 Tax=Toxocara canis TaxID=6265 RepID=A0A0B2V5U9_TOXCA|nr:Sodium-dependent phosphate transporter 1 [Toxocara canis]